MTCLFLTEYSDTGSCLNHEKLSAKVTSEILKLGLFKDGVDSADDTNAELYLLLRCKGLLSNHGGTYVVNSIEEGVIK